MNNKISVVIPVYNTAKYLTKCINSVLNQTYKNLEVILVNDGSTDESANICDKFSNRDNRIKVMHIKNSGPSHARNIGMEVSTGQFIGFVDSDDFLEKDMYETLLNLIQDYEADIAGCSFYRILDNKIIPSYYSGKIRQFDTVSALEELIRSRGLNSNVWNKIYKKDLIKNIKYPLNMHAEDVMFNFKVFAQAKKLAYIDIPKYYYLIRPAGIMGSLCRYKKMDCYYIFLERLDFISRRFPSLFNLTQEKFYRSLLEWYKTIKNNKQKIDDNKKKRDLIKNYIKSNYRSLYSNPLIDWKNKILLKMLKINFELVIELKAFYVLQVKTRLPPFLKSLLDKHNKAYECRQ